MHSHYSGSRKWRVNLCNIYRFNRIWRFNACFRVGASNATEESEPLRACHLIRREKFRGARGLPSAIRPHLVNLTACHLLTIGIRLARTLQVRLLASSKAWRSNCLNSVQQMAATEPMLEHGNRKTILVVDDDPAILNSVVGILSRDYNVLSTSSGKDALRQSKDFKSEIHLLLSDFQMTGMTGIELAIQITAQRAEIKVLLMSGYPAGMLVLNDGWHFLPKPFITSQLIALIASLVSPVKPSRFAT